MNTMPDYTIYCTPEQTKKALELGAPLAIYGNGEMTAEIAKKYNLTPINGVTYIIPTAEQMLGWLEEQGIIVDTISEEENENEILYLASLYKKGYQSLNKELILYPSRKEATIAAIDAALEYLIKN